MLFSQILLHPCADFFFPHTNSLAPVCRWPPYRLIFNGSYCTAEGHFCQYSIHVCRNGQVLSFSHSLSCARVLSSRSLSLSVRVGVGTWVLVRADVSSCIIVILLLTVEGADVRQDHVHDMCFRACVRGDVVCVCLRVCTFVR